MIGKRLDVLPLLLLPVLLIACLIAIVTDAAPVQDSNDVATLDEPALAIRVSATEPAAGGSLDHDRCCLGAIKPIVLTAKPRYKYVVVPPLSIS
uniref:Uncharacterized protein n=1 Tax=Anopheles albimanus TaxID=7167 RepID=A0A182FAL2_ANOAL